MCANLGVNKTWLEGHTLDTLSLNCKLLILYMKILIILHIVLLCVVTNVSSWWTGLLSGSVKCVLSSDFGGKSQFSTKENSAIVEILLIHVKKIIVCDRVFFTNLSFKMAKWNYPQQIHQLATHVLVKFMQVILSKSFQFRSLNEFISLN